MMEVLQSPSHFSSPSSSPLPCAPPVPSNDVLHPHSLISSAISSSVEEDIALEEEKRDREGDEASLLVLLVTLLRKSWVACNNYTERVDEVPRMEIGCPTNVRHVSHVTFDRFHGFLGLPVEFEPEVPRRPPSASFIWGFLPPVIDDDDVSCIIGFDVTGASSTRETKYNTDNVSRSDTEILFSSSCHPYPGLVSASVFGVSTESMQLSFDSRGNSVPTILLLMQNRLYAQGGLQAEGIFRVNAENSQEEDVRDQLNRGVVPDGVDIHCLAGLIKAWFRELPRGVLDSLSPEHVMQSQSEEECGRLVTLLPPTEAALLDWAINLMADVAQLEHANKMNARNVAMVFAPNMTHMADPLTALMYAVQVMNFLKTLIMKTLRDRNETIVESNPVVHGEPSDDNGHHSSSHPFLEKTDEASYGNDEKQVFVAGEPAEESLNRPSKIDPILEAGPLRVSASVDNFPPQVNGIPKETGSTGPTEGARRTFRRKGYENYSEKPFVRVMGSVEKNKGSSIVSRINSSRTERIEAWR